MIDLFFCILICFFLHPVQKTQICYLPRHTWYMITGIRYVKRNYLHLEVSYLWLPDTEAFLFFPSCIRHLTLSLAKKNYNTLCRLRHAPQWPAAHVVVEPVQLQYMDIWDEMSTTELCEKKHLHLDHKWFVQLLYSFSLKKNLKFYSLVLTFLNFFYYHLEVQDPPHMCIPKTSMHNSVKQLVSYRSCYRNTCSDQVVRIKSW